MARHFTATEAEQKLLKDIGLNFDETILSDLKQYTGMHKDNNGAWPAYAQEHNSDWCVMYQDKANELGEKYSDSRYSGDQMYEILSMCRENVPIDDIRQYANPEYSPVRMEALKEASLSSLFTDEKKALLMDPRFNDGQIQEIFWALSEHSMFLKDGRTLTTEEVKTFANPDLSPAQMEEKRLSFYKAAKDQWIDKIRDTFPSDMYQKWEKETGNNGLLYSQLITTHIIEVQSRLNDAHANDKPPTEAINYMENICRHDDTYDTVKKYIGVMSPYSDDFIKTLDKVEEIIAEDKDTYDQIKEAVNATEPDFDTSDKCDEENIEIE